MTYSSICGRAPTTPSRAGDRKSTKTSPRPPPKWKTAVSDTTIERCRVRAGACRCPHSKPRREEIDDEFRQRGAAPLGLVHLLHGGCGDVRVRKGACPSRGAAGLVHRTYRSQGASGLRRSKQHAVLDRQG